MTIRIFAATDADIPGIVRMGRKFWQLTPYARAPYSLPYCPDSAAATCAQCLSQGLLLVACEGEEMIGFAGAVAAAMPLQRSVLVAAEQFWWIEEAARNSGAGKQLMAELEHSARIAGVRILAMAAFEQIEIEKAAGMYARAGYDATERTFTRAL